MIVDPCGMEVKLTDNIKSGSDGDEIEKLESHELVARLQQVTQQRDDLISQLEAMAAQVDESAHKLGDANLDAQRYAQKATDAERQFEREAARVNTLSAQLDDERRKEAAIVAELDHYRNSIDDATFKDPWLALDRAASQICNDWIKCARAHIPADSSFLPLFDKAMVFLTSAIRLFLSGVKIIGCWLIRTVKGIGKEPKS